MPRKKKRDPDYTLNIFHHYDEKIKHPVLVFLVQTTKIFVSFRYEILLEHKLTDRNIDLKITGLHVPELLMPQSGPAQGRCDFNHLDGHYNLHITKQDKTVNEFSIKILTDKVEILNRPKAPFILVSGDPVNMN